MKCQQCRFPGFADECFDFGLERGPPWFGTYLVALRHQTYEFVFGVRANSLSAVYPANAAGGGV